MKHNYLSFLSLVRAGSALLLLASVTLLALGQFLWGVACWCCPLLYPSGCTAARTAAGSWTSG